jgi:ribosomal protein S18 acetylase RimI-like enzyme
MTPPLGPAPLGSVTLRRAVPGDAIGIADTFVETWQATYPGLVPDRVLVRMSKESQARYWEGVTANRLGDDFVIVAVNARGRVLGFGSAGPDRDGTPHRGEIQTLYLRPDFQGRGLGRALIDGLLGELRERGFADAIVWVLAGNPARFFYERVGGRKVQERSETLWNEKLPQIGYLWPDLEARFAARQADDERPERA